jgi:hypothetical protein
MSVPSSPGAGSASAASPSAAPARERQHWLRSAFGVFLFVAWGILTIVWVASTVYLVAHGTFTAVITAVCAVALLLLLGGMEGLEVSVIDRWQKWWPAMKESGLAGWLAARQLFVALIVTAATLLADRSVVIIPGTSVMFKNGFVLSVFDLLWTTLTVLWFAQIFWKHLGATNPDRYLEAFSKYLFPIVEVVRKIGISQPGEWTADFVESQILWPASYEQLEQGKPDHPLTHGDIWRMIRSDRRLEHAHRGPADAHRGPADAHRGPADARGGPADASGPKPA